DSGLMLFSRFPFLSLPKAAYKAEADDVDARNQGSDWKDVAFIEYDYDVFPDNWAAKGCALVRIQNPETDRVYNVAFTHMQASYPEDEDDQAEWLEPIQARFGQLFQIQEMIEGTLNSQNLAREEVFLLGDMNIDGDLADPDLGVAGYDQPNLWEWVQTFNNASGGFFTDFLVDSWAFEHPKADRGLTNLYHWGPEYSPDQGARLDYFLRNHKRTEDLCVQHLTKGYNLRWGAPYIDTGAGPAGTTELSDHIAINAELNVLTDRCNPRMAWTNPPKNTFLTFNLTHPGEAKWLRFDEPGTYGFAMKSAGTFEVYQDQDLTIPVPQYYDETISFMTREGIPVVAPKFINPKPPLFVKVMASPRAATGPVEFVAHKATCQTKEEACALRAFENYAHTMPGVPVAPDDRFWFEIHTEAADSGGSQNLAFQVGAFAPVGAFSMQLLAEDGTTVIDEDLMTEPDPITPGEWILRIFRDDLPPQASTMYLVAKRNNVNSTSLKARWETNLTILHGQSVGVPGAAQANVYCVEETDSIGIDEISLTVTVDGTTVVDDVYIGDFDNGDYVSLESYLHAIRYLDEVKITLRDEDGAANGDDDYLVATVPTLSTGVTEALNETSVAACCDGKYLIRYNRSRSLQQED
ncbi:MAG: hypothetical protein KC466_05320, partial [Myxococcales bacterium]|nr:hypothetical protein [Myxococcales bacterium]